LLLDGIGGGEIALVSKDVGEITTYSGIGHRMRRRAEMRVRHLPKVLGTRYLRY
jgi:hypothetical protein